MNLRFTTTSRQQGSVLAMALITAGIIGITLLSYLSLVSTQQRSIYRSLNWNSVMPVCEAGIEEAMAHLNNVGAGERATNGWVLTNNQYYMARNPFMDTNSWYMVYISVADPPVITASGYTYIPMNNTTLTRNVRVTTTRRSTGQTGLVAKNDITLGALSTVDSFNSLVNPVYSSGVSASNAFVGAVEGSISGGDLIKGNAGTGASGSVSTPVTGFVISDLNVSFPDVSNPTNGSWYSIPQNVNVITTNYATATNTYSTNTYPSPAPTGTVTTNYVTSTSTTRPATNILYSSTTSNATTTTWPGVAYNPITTNTTYLTNQSSAPTAGTYLIPPGYTTNASSSVTNVVVSQRGNSGNYTTNYVVTPAGQTVYSYYRIDSYTYRVTNYTTTNTTYYITSSITNLTYSTNRYDYALGTANYSASSQLTMSGSSEMLVYGNAVLWLKGGVKLSGNAQISVLAGASLTIYVGETGGSAVSADFSGNGLVNMNGNAEKVTVLGLPNLASVTASGNAGFTGTIYAPEATLVGNGGGNNNYDMVGAVIVNKVRFNGHVNFHYDEKLGDNKAVTEWNVASWTEY